MTGLPGVCCHEETEIEPRPGGVKGFFIQHIEKIVFGVAILLVLAFVFLGYTPGIQTGRKDSRQTPVARYHRRGQIERPTFASSRRSALRATGRAASILSVCMASIRSTRSSTPSSRGINHWADPAANAKIPRYFRRSNSKRRRLPGAICLRRRGRESPLAKLENAPAPEEGKGGIEEKSRQVAWHRPHGAWRQQPPRRRVRWLGRHGYGKPVRRGRER